MDGTYGYTLTISPRNEKDEKLMSSSMGNSKTRAKFNVKSEDRYISQQWTGSAKVVLCPLEVYVVTKVLTYASYISRSSSRGGGLLPQPKMEPLQWTANLPWREFSRNYAFQPYLSSGQHSKICAIVPNSHYTEGHSGTLTVTASLANTIGHMFPHIHQELMHALNSDLLNFIGLKKTNEDRTSSRACEGQVPK